MRISDWSSDVCSSDLPMVIFGASGITGVTVAYAIGGGIIDLFESGVFEAWPVIGDLSVWRATLVLVGIPGILLGLLLVTTTRDPPRDRKSTRLNSSH